MFFRLDEHAMPVGAGEAGRKLDTGKKVTATVAPLPRGVWTAERTLLDSFAACMIVTVLLELWRLGFASGPAARATRPWFGS
jgi:hypothetical protein